MLWFAPASLQGPSLGAIHVMWYTSTYHTGKLCVGCCVHFSTIILVQICTAKLPFTTVLPAKLLLFAYNSLAITPTPGTFRMQPCQTQSLRSAVYSNRSTWSRENNGKYEGYRRSYKLLRIILDGHGSFKERVSLLLRCFIESFSALQGLLHQNHPSVQYPANAGSEATQDLGRCQAPQTPTEPVLLG